MLLYGYVPFVTVQTNIVEIVKLQKKIKKINK